MLRLSADPIAGRVANRKRIEKGLLGPVTLVTAGIPVPAGRPRRHVDHVPRTVEPLRVSFSTSSLTLRSSLQYCMFVPSIA